jgi:UDP-N-acetylmuramate--alanine ligase
VIKNYHSVYFLGIGGIGMSALARWFKIHGAEVEGYDRTRTSLCQELENEGIEIHYEDNVNLISDQFKDPETLVIYTPAVPASHNELNYFREKGFSVKKRSEVLGMLTEAFFTVAVAGTHGKTTTSSMVAHVLKEAGKNIFAFIGGISRNYNTNILMGDKSSEEQIMVVEADEFDRSFLTLQPNIAIITSIEADHLDIYGDSQMVEDSFNAFAIKIVKDGVLIHKEGLQIKVPGWVKSETFDLGPGSYSAENIKVENGFFCFDVKGKISIANIRLQVPGNHNILNALAAIAVADKLGISGEKIREALENFRGVKRRFEVIVKTDDIIYIDDYAHHPTEISATLSAARGLYPGKKITIVFQPHLYSRTRDFMAEFGESLSLADQVILLPVYPARETPIPGITSEALLEKVSAREKEVVQKDALTQRIKALNTDVLLTVGAGDIDQFVEPVKKVLEQ